MTESQIYSPRDVWNAVMQFDPRIKSSLCASGPQGTVIYFSIKIAIYFKRWMLPSRVEAPLCFHFTEQKGHFLIVKFSLRNISYEQMTHLTAVIIQAGNYFPLDECAMYVCIIKCQEKNTSDDRFEKYNDI